METIGKCAIYSFLNGVNSIQSTTNHAIRHDIGCHVNNFLELAKKIAELQFYNPKYVFLFRGQNQDWKNLKNNSTIKPSLFRPMAGSKKLPTSAVLTNRFARLIKAEELLMQAYHKNTFFSGKQKIQRQRILRWAILQHYEICFTPLLDVTQSLRIASSFATRPNCDQAWIYVLGVPNLSGTLTANMEAGLQIVGRSR